MAKYYNKSNGPLAISLRSGKSACFGWKTWTEVAPEDEGSEDIIRAVKLGFLTRFAGDDVPVPAAPAEVPAAPAAPASPAALLAAPVVVESTSEDAVPASRKKR